MRHLLTLILVIALGDIAKSQCPGCVPTNCASTNPDGGLCDTVITGMANHPMDQQISFYMPTQVYTTLLPGGGYVQLDRIQVTGITGLPLGLNWETNAAPTNEYYPQSGDSIGCARVCGTPIQAGTYPLTIYLLADVTAPIVGQVTNQAQVYSNAVVIVLPDTSGGVASFSITPNISLSCDPLTLEFEAKIDGSPNRTTWDWDFGNGNTGTGKNPGSQTYTAPNVYPVTLTTSIYNYVITEVRVLNVNNSYTGDIEELTTLQNPDLYFTLPELGYTSSSGSDSKTATWSGLHIEVPQGFTQVTLRIWDDDNGPPFGSQDDSLGRATINLSLGTFLWDDANGTVTEGLITIGDTVGNQLTETLNITVASKPTATLESVAGDSICGGDTTALILSGTDIYQYEWFKDSIYLPSANDTFLEVTQSGSYWVETVSALGCELTTEPYQFTALPPLPVPLFYLNAQQNLLYTINSSSASLIQWYKNEIVIPGENGTSLALTDTGTYKVEYRNQLDCSSISGNLQVSVLTSIDEIEEGVSLSVFPNPSDGNFTIELTLPKPQDVHIMLTDRLGKKISHATFSTGAPVFKKTFDLSGLPRGIYVLQVSTANVQTVKKILITD